jgi:hypothetical protein
MNETDKPIHVDAQDARSGTTPHIVRYVLGISMALAIVAMLVIWAIVRG